MPQFKALISDLDGTLVDTEPAHCNAWLEVLREYGLDFDHGWFEQWIGTSDRFLAENTIEEHGINAGVRELQLKKQAVYYEIVRKGNLLFPNITPLLASINAGYPTAIATNSGRTDAIEVFAATGLTDFFDLSFTADDVANMKPAPDMYLLAAKELGVEPNEAIVCEDSPAGIAGAKAAGCYIIGITSSQPADKLQQADEIVADSETAFRRVLELLTS